MAKISSLILCLFCFQISMAQTLNLSIVGASKKETKVIDSLDYSSSFEDFQSLQIEVTEFGKTLEQIGYIEQQLVSLKKENDSTFKASFNLNRLYSIIHLYNKALIPPKIIKRFNFDVQDDYIVMQIANLESNLNLINLEMANLGNPFSRLKLTDITKDEKGYLIADLATSKREDRTVDNIIIKGYEKFPKSYLKHFLKIKTGQRFNLASIKQKTEDLDNLQFANITRDPEVLFTSDSTTLYMYIEKNRSNTFDGFLGFGTNESTNNIEFDGYLDLRLNNNLNYGESLELLYKSDENDQQTFNLSLRMPFVLSTPIGLEASLNIFRRDSTFSTSRQTAKINYQISSRHLVSLGVQAEASTNLLDNNSILINDYDSNRYFVNYQYLERQNKNLLFPINFLFDISAGTGSRNVLEIKNDQYNIEINTYKIFNLNARNSIYGRISGQYLDSNNYLENELPRFGGINSIRGFEENSLIANLYAVLNTEYRYKLSNSIYAHSVIDAAYFENKITNQKEKLFGFGFGFGLVTQAGLFKFNYTSAKTENQPFRLSDSKIHISLTALF